MSRTLLIDDTPENDLLVHREQVVFPVRDRTVRQRLETLAYDAGCAIRSVRGEPAQFTPHADRSATRGLVGYLGEDLRPVAQLYAHLTHRTAVMPLTDRCEHSV